MQNYSYGWENLYLTMCSLISTGDIRERLYNGLVFNAIHITPENDLPEEIQENFKTFWEHVTSVQPAGSGDDIKATLATFSDEELNKAAQQLFSFYDTVCRYIGD
jgi:hypothetical protein